MFVVSNQRGVALGHYSIEDVEVVQDGLQKALKSGGAHVDRFYSISAPTIETNAPAENRSRAFLNAHEPNSPV